ncbi:ABC transporter permease [Virgisporangium aurantiacum]|uniref:ABC-2 type transport system permease protein n=1 Tax=Virgisporangium aurantiacum TaxID=175570 RepID=A0A8J3Z4D2_9ACTN|nr:ABC transporter permease [Virgisporangium aurantiacum]GIJ56552.1 hypothetical protein Vau01_040680 [Virgisporangium aurantiacum]
MTHPGGWPVLRTEWTKLITVRSTPWLAAGTVGLMVAAGAVAVWSLSSTACTVPDACGDEDLTRLALSGVYTGQILAVLTAVMAVTPEYTSGEIRTTLTAVPQRLRVFAAKATVVLAVALAAGVLATLGSLAAAWMILPGRRFDGPGYVAPSLADAPTLRAAGGTVLYLALLAALGFAVAMVFRSGPGAVATVLAGLFILPQVAALMTDEETRELIQRVSPMTAGLAIQATRRLDALPIGPWQGLGVLTAYAAGGLVLALVLFLYRDA